MNWISFFVRRPIATLMGLSIFFFFGLIGIFKIPVDLFPNVSHPRISIMTTYENASADEVEKEITKPLEEELSFLKNLTTLESVSKEGKSQIHLHFRWGTEMNFAALEAREKIDVIKSSLPEASDDPVVERFNPNDQPILVLNLVAQKSERELRSLADTRLKPVIERILGVAQVRVFGGAEEEIEIQVSQDLLKSFKISLSDVITSLKTENISSRGGSLLEGRTHLLIKVSGELTSLEDIENVIITKRNEVPVTLKNIGTIRRIEKRRKNFSTLNQHPAVSIEIYKEPTGNTLDIIGTLKERLSELEKETQVGLLTTYDQSDYIRNAVAMVEGNALLGALLTTLILFIFLKSFASTLIVFVSIPFSIICSFFFLYLSGVSLNIFSLAGIALALGMVVDSSIVILENIFVHLSTDEKPRGATVRGTVEVSGAVIASTLTTLAVFIPILFVKGPMGLIFRDLSLSIIYGLIFSMLVSFSFIPMIAAVLFKHKKEDKKLYETLDEWRAWVDQGIHILDRLYHLGTKVTHLYEQILKRFTLTPRELYKKALETTKVGEEKIEDIERTVEKRYERTLKEALQSWRSRLTVIITVSVAFLGACLFIPKTEFLPQSLQKNYEITLSHPTGISLEQSHMTTQQVDQFIQTLRGIKSVQSQVEAGLSRHFIELERPKQAAQALKELEQFLEKIPDVYFEISAITPLNAITAGLESRTVDLKLRGENLALLKTESERLVNLLKKERSVQSATSLYKPGKPEIKIQVDRDRASDYGLRAQDIATHLKNQLTGIKATEVDIGESKLPVTVRGAQIALDTQQALYDLLIPSPLGIFVPLQSVASFQETFSPATLYREEKEQTVTVLAHLKSKASPDDILENIERFTPSPEITLKPGPHIQTIMKSFAELKIALWVAVILIYMIMAAQFESFSHPFTILFSIPLSLIGITASLRLTGHFLSLPAFIGIIILAGIVVNNSIILIDYINILRRRGIDREEAILQAGKRRLRPILMTSLTTILGMIPLALGFGTGSELYQPLAVVMVGGMITSTLLTLLFIPTIYCFFDDLGDIIGFGLLKLQLMLSMKK